MSGRTKIQKPELEFGFWRKVGTQYVADHQGLKAEIQRQGNSDRVIRVRMQYGYRYLLDALEGKALSIWEAKHVEWGVLKEDRAWVREL